MNGLETMRRMRKRTCVALLASLPGACAGLSDTVADLVPREDGPSGDERRDAQASDDASTDTVPLLPDAADDAQGPAQDLADAGASAAADGGVCLGSLAAQTFRHALCACGNLNLSFGGLSTDAYDSRVGRYDASRAVLVGSHVGVNDKFASTSPVAVGGSLIVADALGPDALPALNVRGDLRVGGPLSYSQSIEVGQNLWLASDLRGSSPLHVAGNLVQPPSAARDTTLPPQIDGKDVRAPVAVGNPCPCEADKQLDIETFVAAAKAHNDDEAAGIKPDRLASPFVAERIELPSGKRVFLTSIGLELGTPIDGTFGSVTFVVEGHSTLVIESSISIGGDLSFELGPEAELDLFVGRDVSLGVLQAPPLAGHRPARLRVYVGGGYFHGQVFGEANVYAPRAYTFVLNTDLYGSLFAKDIDVTGGDLRVHYDTAVLAEARDCDWFDLSLTP